MEFNGFVAADFDFFKKKEKMIKEEYDKMRNDFKLHFRKFCYEMQKLYHKETNGVLNLDKEFHGFSKKSEDIFAFRIISEAAQLKIMLNSECLAVALEIKCEKYEHLLTKNKDTLWNFLLSNKHAFVELIPNNKNSKRIRLLSHEVNTKNFESLSSAINNLSNKAAALIQIGYTFNKNECIRLGKDLVKYAYEGVIKIEELVNNIL